ncbi:hypothetical protein C8F01DRAFT_1234294 [Mycena amicta]|nr:hypothetical protein C8F01DRAFT_1234294 [Mycena amicta]
MSSQNDDASTKIPPEIISEIFIHCLPASPSPPSAETAPLLLSQICTLWRDIALSTPDLWSNIVLKDDLKASAEILRLWSARARAIPMTFSLETYNGELGRDMLVAAMESREHWRSVDLYLPVQSYAVLGSISNASLPNLRHLSLRVKWIHFGGGSRSPDVRLLPSLNLYGASQLRELRLFTFPCTLLHGVPLEHLTTLNMAHYGTPLLDDLTILRSCNSLGRLTLYNGGPEPILPTSPEVVHLPHLESLLVTSTSIMRHLFLPLLRRLTMRLSHYAVQDVLPLIPKWGCTLEALEVIPQAILPELFPQLLAALPSLKELHLECTYIFPNGLLPETVGMLNGEGILPQLEALRIICYFSAAGEEYIPRQLRDFLRKKAKSVRVFKSFILILPRDTSPSEGEWVMGQLKVLSDNKFNTDVVMSDVHLY